MKNYKIKYLTVLNYWKGKRYQSTNIIAPDPAAAEVEACKVIEGDRGSLSKQVYDIQVWLDGKKIPVGC